MNKNILYLGLVSFFTDFSSALINPILPIFIVTYLHEGVDKVGIVVAIATLISYILRIASGYISDRYGITKPLLYLGYGLSALSKPLLSFTHSYKSIAALKGLERLGKALRSAPKDALIAHFGSKKEGRAFGYHKTFDIAGEFFGTLTLVAIFYTFGQSEEVIRNVFLFTIFPGILALLFLLPVQNVAKKPSIQKFTLEPSDKALVGELFIYTLFIFFFFSDALFLVAAKEHGATLFVVPLLYLLYTGTQTLTSYYLGALVDRLGYRNVSLFAFFSAALALMLLPAFLWASFFFLGLFQVAYLNSVRALIAKKATNRATIYGIFYALYALMGSSGALLFSQIWHRLGFESARIAALIAIALLILIYYLKEFHGQKRI